MENENGSYYRNLKESFECYNRDKRQRRKKAKFNLIMFISSIGFMIILTLTGLIDVIGNTVIEFIANLFKSL